MRSSPPWHSAKTLTARSARTPSRSTLVKAVGARCFPPGTCPPPLPASITEVGGPSHWCWYSRFCLSKRPAYAAPTASSLFPDPLPSTCRRRVIDSGSDFPTTAVDHIFQVLPIDIDGLESGRTKVSELL